MSSQPYVRPAGVPTIQYLPPGVHSLAAATEAIALGEAYGLNLDLDQQATIRAALGEREDGSWAASQVCDFKGRQAGKNDTVKVRQLAGLVLFGERLILHTAHKFDTANEDFLRLVAVFEAYDDLRKRVQRVRYANGEQGIEFKSGARIKYMARTSGGGRGFAEADLVVYDESQHLEPEHLAASLPTLLVNPNFQAWYCGSGGIAKSAVARQMRRNAVKGNAGRMAYTECTAQRLTLGDDGRIAVEDPDPARLLDHEVLLVHPGYANGRVPYESMVSMYDQLGPEKFAREFLCVWDPDPSDEAGALIPAEWWEQLGSDPSSAIVSHAQWALEVSQDRKWSTFGAAGRRVDGHLHVDVVDRRPNTAWVVDRAREIFERNGGVPVRIRRGSPAASFIAPLVEAGVTVVEMSREEHAQAAGLFLDAVNDGTLHHLNGGSLAMAVRHAVLSTAGDAAVWSPRSSKVDISPLVAVTLALGGVPSAGKVREFFVY